MNVKRNANIPSQVKTGSSSNEFHDVLHFTELSKQDVVNSSQINA